LVDRYELDSRGSRGCRRHRFWYHKVISTSKKNCEIRKNERYKLLRENVFDRLANLRLQILDYDGQSEDVLKLSFNDDISEIKESNYYEEAEMHLKDDLPDYLNGLTKLEDDVKEHNTDVVRFIDCEIPKLVTNYLLIIRF
jgi:hypothetical protein